MVIRFQQGRCETTLDRIAQADALYDVCGATPPLLCLNLCPAFFLAAVCVVRRGFCALTAAISVAAAAFSGLCVQ